MALPKFLPTWLGGEALSVDGCGVMLPASAPVAVETYTVGASLPHDASDSSPGFVGTAVQMAECEWCGSYHTGRCPKVKAIEYHPNGAVKRVEFVTGPGK